MRPRSIVLPARDGAVLKIDRLVKCNPFAKLKSHVLQYVSPSAYAAQRMGGKAGSVRREHEVPQIVEFMDMRELSYNKTSKLSIDQPLFLASPSEVTFQNFVPLQEYEVAVVFRNADTVPRRLKVLHSNTP